MYIYYLLVYTVNIVFDAFLHDLYVLVDVFKRHKFYVTIISVSYTHLRAHETVLDLVTLHSLACE